jgi:hypothetical protein
VPISLLSPRIRKRPVAKPEVSNAVATGYIVEKSLPEDESRLVVINWLKSVLGMTEVTTSERRNCRSWLQLCRILAPVDKRRSSIRLVP